MGKSFGVLFFAFLSMLCCAWPALAIPPSVVRLTAGGAPVNWPIQSQWRWKKNSEGAIVLFAYVSITIPKDVTAGRSTSSTVRMKLKDQSLLIQSGALKGKFELTRAGRSYPFELNISPPKPALIVADCETLGLTLNARQDLPFFIGARCVSTGEIAKGKAQLHLTIPEEADIDQSTLFEQNGKGESWRIYDLGKIDTGAAENGRIVVRFHDKPYDLYLIWSDRSKSNNLKPPFEKNFAFGLGYSMLKLQGTDSSSSVTQYLARLKYLPSLLMPKLGFGLDLDANFGLSSATNQINTIQFAPYGFYRLLQTASLIVDPRLYMVMDSEQQTGTGVGFYTTQIGLGLMVAFQATQSWQTHFEFRTESVGSKVIKSHQMLDFGLNEIGRQRSVRFGLGAILQTYKVNDALDNAYTFGQTSIYGLMLF